jgi:biopolymer transport protein ExbD
MAVKIGGKGGSMSDINMTPMIDIMLVLLIIFMIVQQGMQKGIEVQVPPTEETADKAQAIDQIVLDIQPGGTYFLNQEPVPAGQLQQKLTSTFSTRVRKVIFVRGAENLAYGEVVYAVDAARGAGVDLVGLVPRSP